MISGSFDIRIDTPKTFKRGTVSLSGEHGQLVAHATVGAVENAELHGTCADKEFELSGTVDVPGQGAVDCTFKGSVWGNSIDATGETGIGKVEVRGTSISTSTGDAGGKPGSMYAGRWSDGY